MKECAVVGCGRESFDKGLCRAHLIRQKLTDDGKDTKEKEVCAKCGAKRGEKGAKRFHGDECMRCYQTGKPRARRSAAPSREKKPRARRKGRGLPSKGSIRNNGLDMDVLAGAIAAVEAISASRGGFSPEKRARFTASIYQFVLEKERRGGDERGD